MARQCLAVFQWKKKDELELWLLLRSHFGGVLLNGDLGLFLLRNMDENMTIFLDIYPFQKG